MYNLYVLLFFFEEYWDVGARLVDTTYNDVGRLEILFGGIWGSVCQPYHFKMHKMHKAAEVACRQMGFKSGIALYAAHQFGDSSSIFWLEDPSCSGSEKHLGECSPDKFGVQTSDAAICKNHDIAAACYNHGNIELQRQFMFISNELYFYHFLLVMYDLWSLKKRHYDC